MTYFWAIACFVSAGSFMLLGDWLFNRYWEPKGPRRSGRDRLRHGGLVLIAIAVFRLGTVLSAQGLSLLDTRTQRKEIIASVADECRALQSTLADAASSEQSAKPAATVMLAVALSSRAFVGAEHAELRQVIRNSATSLANYNYRVSHLHIASRQPTGPVGISE